MRPTARREGASEKDTPFLEDHFRVVAPFLPPLVLLSSFVGSPTSDNKTATVEEKEPPSEYHPTKGTRPPSEHYYTSSRAHRTAPFEWSVKCAVRNSGGGGDHKA